MELDIQDEGREEVTKRTRVLVARMISGLATLSLVLPTAAIAVPAGPVVASPKNNSLLATSDIEITGTVDGSTVEVRVIEGSSIVASGGVAGGGFRVVVGNVSEGLHNYVIRGRDASNVFGPDTNLSVTVDTTAPAAPVITAPTAGSLVAHSPVIVEGIAEPLTQIDVRDLGTGSKFTTIADGGGAWEVSASLGDGTRTIAATATDRAGNAGPQSSSVQFRIDTFPPAAPVITLPGEGTSHRFSSLTFEGLAEPGSTVSLSEGSLLASIVANGDSTWRTTINFSEGTHQVSARAVDAAGHPGPATTRQFIVDLTAPDPPVILTPTQLAVVAARGILITGRAESLSTVTVLRGGAVVGTAEVDSKGDWFLVMTEAPAGRNEIVAKARDLAGNLGQASAIRVFDVDGTPPTVDITTEDGSTFLFAPPIIEGNAADDYGVLRVELAFYDVLGRGVASSIAFCPLCPVGKQVYWRSSESPLAGRFIVKAYAVDRVGNRSAEQSITITIVRTP